MANAARTVESKVFVGLWLHSPRPPRIRAPVGHTHPASGPVQFRSYLSKGFLPWYKWWTPINSVVFHWHFPPFRIMRRKNQRCQRNTAQIVMLSWLSPVVVLDYWSLKLAEQPSSRACACTSENRNVLAASNNWKETIDWRSLVLIPFRCELFWLVDLNPMADDITFNFHRSVVANHRPADHQLVSTAVA